MKKSRRHTALGKRSKHGQTVRSPFHALGNKVSWSSWKDDFLPNVLWACVATGVMDRDVYLDLFRRIGVRARSRWKDTKYVSLTHTGLSSTDYADFEYAFDPLRNIKGGSQISNAIASIGSMPDRDHWQKFHAIEPDTEKAWEALAHGIMACIDHQSQQSTDVRWLKVAYLAICGRLVLPNEELIEEIRLYPDKGEMTKVRPMIRATEMSIRMMEMEAERPSEAPLFPVEAFWSELYTSTKCFVASPKKSTTEDIISLTKELSSIANDVMSHFYQCSKNTGIDPRLDGAFGLCLYNLHLAIELAALPSNFLSSGRILLRSIVEACITLRYLTAKDDAGLWKQYRNYGSGQTALAFLKTIDLDDAPSYVDLEALEMLANEDAWFETQDILIGAWDKKSLREMAIECDRKDLYDKYYDWLSGFSHGHWGAVRDTSFTICLNPMHRLHRIPIFGHVKPSVLPDVSKLINLILDDLNHLYPSFKPRIKWHKTNKPTDKVSKKPKSKTAG